LKWAFVSIGAPLLGNMEGRSFPRAFERRESFLYLGKIFMRNLICKKGPVNGNTLHKGPFGEPGGDSFTGTFERKRKCISGFLFLDPEEIKS